MTQENLVQLNLTLNVFNSELSKNNKRVLVVTNRCAVLREEEKKLNIYFGKSQSESVEYGQLVSV